MKKIFIFFFLLFFCARTAAPSQNAVRAYLFYSPDCAKCVAVERLIPKLQSRYPFEVKSFDIDDPKNYEMLILLEKKYGVKKSDLPELFIGDSVLAGGGEIAAGLEKKIKRLLARGGSEWPDNIQTGSGKVIVERFKSFNILAVLSAGIIDGINPCAFATLIFFISFLSFIGRRKKEILLAGIFFTAAVFCTYLLIGLGAFRFLRSLEVFFMISKSIYYGVGILAMALGSFSLYDYFKIKSGKTSEMTLQLPEKLKKIIHSVIRANMTSSSLIIAAIFTGFCISVLESICTGQVYLPTIVYILKTPGMQTQAFTYLVFYNLMFILPLAIIFGLTYLGASSDWLGRIMKKNLGLIKILSAFLFFGLGILLLAM